jgi:hypothetical protein
LGCSRPHELRCRGLRLDPRIAKHEGVLQLFRQHEAGPVELADGRRRLRSRDRREHRIAAQPQRTERRRVLRLRLQRGDDRSVDRLAARAQPFLGELEALHVVAVLGERQHVRPRPDEVDPLSARVDAGDAESLHGTSM